MTIGLDVDLTKASCSFCGARPDAVGRLIAGPEVWICDGCVTVCYEILQSLPPRAPGVTAPAQADEVMSTLAAIQQRALDGRRDEAADAFLALWEQVDPEGPALHRLSIAHYLADLQDDADAELLWNRRALEAADEDPGAAEIRPLRASLLVNLAGSLHRVGRSDDARQRLAEAEAAAPDLPPDGYGTLVRSEIEALRRALSLRP